MTPGCLGDLVESRSVRIRTIRPETSHSAGYDAGVDLVEGGIVNPEALRHAGTEVADDDIRCGNQVMERGEAIGVLEIEGDTFLVAIERDVVGAHALERVLRVIREQLARALALQRFDLDRLGTKICQDHRTIGARQHVGQVQDADTG